MILYNILYDVITYQNTSHLINVIVYDTIRWYKMMISNYFIIYDIISYHILL